MKYQVVILAGGESSRFFPFNNLHKSFFKIAGKTILGRTVESVKKQDPSEIILVLGSKNFEQEKKLCQENKIFRDVRYVSERKPLGQADAILAAKEFIKDDFFVINANQFNFHEFAEDFIKEHTKSKNMATLGIIETDTPSKYGMVDLKGNKVKGIVEKPDEDKTPSNMRLVGIYMFSKKFLTELSATPISNYSLEDTLNRIAKEGTVGSVSLSVTTPSLKYPWDLFDIKDIILSDIKTKIDDSAIIEETAIIKGKNIFIGKNAHICDFSVIEGPTYIGENAVVGVYSQVRGGTVLEDGVQIERYTDVKNSIIGENTHIHSGFIGSSVFGKDCRVGAEFVTANKRLDRNTVNVLVRGENVDSTKDDIGIFAGDNVKIGIRVSAMPGTVVGKDSVVYPGVTLKDFSDNNSKVED